MDEIWLELPIRKNNHSLTAIVAVSNLGNMRRINGVIESIPLRQQVSIDGVRVHVYRILLEHFKPKTEEDIALGRDYIDHITHNPVDMNVNDIRNIRWCTIKENSSFDEVKHNLSKALKGRTYSEETKRKISEAKKGKPNLKNREIFKGAHWKIINGKRIWYANRLQ